MLNKIIFSRKISFGLPAALFVVNGLLIFYSLLTSSNPDFWLILGPIFHFLGGVLMAILFLHFLETHGEFSSLRGKWLAVLVLTVSFAALAGVLWEFYEFGLDLVFLKTNVFHEAQPSLEDTMADLFLDLLGGLFLGALYLWSRKH